MHRLSALLGGLAFALAPLAAYAEPAVVIPPPAHEAPAPASGFETAVLAGGCFWGVQAVFQHVKGVTNAVSGYAGGAQKDADYETRQRASTPATPKACGSPSIRSRFPTARSCRSISRWRTIRPSSTTRGPIDGTQYRSEIFPQSDEQQTAARDYIAQLDKAHVFKAPIVTKTGTMKQAFFPAEAYHQDYATLHPNQPYIAYNDAPKVENLKKLFPDVWREKPVLVSEASKTN